MSVYNDEDRVPQAIESILKQSFENFEFLIVDDCSSDTTFTICNEYQKDNRIKLFRNKKYWLNEVIKFFNKSIKIWIIS